MLGLAGQLMSIPTDFLVKTGGFSDFYGSVVQSLPAVTNETLLEPIATRAARLLCLTDEFAPLWLSMTGQEWTRDSACRLAVERREIQIQLDVLSALCLGISVEELCTIYRTQFPVLRGYETNDLYDANGRKVPGVINKLFRQHGESLSAEERTWTHPQSGVEYVFEFPFQSFDREEDMRKAYTHFEQLLAEKQIEELAK